MDEETGKILQRDFEEQKSRDRIKRQERVHLQYAEYAAPVTMLKGNREETKKGSKKALVSNEESDRAFVEMKQALLSAVGLHLVDPDRAFVLRTDASDYAVGAVLEQVLDDGGHVPVAFWS